MKLALQNFANYFRKSYCVLCDLNSHKLNSCKKYSSFEERKKRCEKLNLCSKYTSRKHKNEGCTGRKNRLRLACLKCNSKCHISALCDKPKTTSLYTSLEISQRNDETYILPEVQITFSNGVRRMAVNCTLDTGSQRSYFTDNITYYLKSSKGGKITNEHLYLPHH